MGWPLLSAVQTIVAIASLAYPSFPFWWSNPVTGSRFLVYRDGDGTHSVDHSSGGAYWIRRNEGSSTKLWDSTSFGSAEVQDAFIVHDPSFTTGSGRMVALIRTFDGANNASWTSVSTDDGVTWSTPTGMAAVTGFTMTDFQFFDFALSADGTKVYGTAYGPYTGHGSYTAALCQSSNGVTWTVRSIITYGDVWSGQEAGLGRMPDGRLVSVIRPTTNLASIATFTSDDDGATWSAANVQAGDSSILQAPRPVLPLDVNHFACFSRYRGSTWQIGLTWSVFDRSGNLIFTAPTQFIGNPSSVGYATRGTEADGDEYLYFYQDPDPAQTNKPALQKARLRRRVGSYARALP